jgi:guanylate kinase
MARYPGIASCQVIVFDGPTGAGKSVLLAWLHDEYRQAVLVGKKLTTRNKRLDDAEWEFEFVHKLPEVSSVYRFESVGNEYAVKSDDIRQAVAQNLTYAISCVDRGTIDRLRSEFNTVLIYVYRSISFDDREHVLQSRCFGSLSELELRRAELATIITSYGERITDYDHVILNIGSKSQMLRQLSNILGSYGIRRDLTRSVGSKFTL